MVRLFDEDQYHQFFFSFVVYCWERCGATGPVVVFKTAKVSRVLELVVVIGTAESAVVLGTAEPVAAHLCFYY